MCRPQFCEADPSRGAVFEAQGVRHPCVRPAVGSKVTAVVPNDVGIGGAGPLAVLLTGPNMGGKSTVMRSVCVAVIMAQLGCYVCADQCRLSVVDRIFTRIGATDRIMSGQSTFMVELEVPAPWRGADVQGRTPFPSPQPPPPPLGSVSEGRRVRER